MLIANFLILIISIIIFVFLIQGAKNYILGDMPYVPSNNKVIKAMLKLADLKDGDRVLDMGSGDGRAIIALVKHNPNIHVTGYEINIVLVLLSKLLVQLFLDEGDVTIKQADFLKKDVSKFDTIFVYGISHMMPKLEEKFANECKQGTKVISNNFTFPNKEPVKSIDNVHLYKF